MIGRIKSTKEKLFYDTSIQNCIENAFQALALDESRASFSPALWEKPRGNTTVRIWSLANSTSCTSKADRKEFEASLVSRGSFQHRGRGWRSGPRGHHFGMDDGSSKPFSRLHAWIYPGRKWGDDGLLSKQRRESATLVIWYLPLRRFLMVHLVDCWKQAKSWNLWLASTTLEVVLLVRQETISKSTRIPAELPQNL